MLFAFGPDEIETWFDLIWRVIVGGLIGAVTVAVPLWGRIQKVARRSKETEIDLKEKLAAFENKTRIDHESEWKRIIEFRDVERTRILELRDAELARLVKDNAQYEKKIADLQEKYVLCQRAEARLSEQIRNNQLQIAGLNKKLGVKDDSNAAPDSN